MAVNKYVFDIEVGSNNWYLKMSKNQHQYFGSITWRISLYRCKH